MIGTLGYGDDADETGAVESGHLPVENNDIRRHLTYQRKPGLTIRRIIDVLHADAQEHRTHDLAHIMLVVHHHDFGGREPFGELF